MRKAERSMNDGYGAGEKFGWGHVPSNPREVDMSEGIRSVVVTKDEQGNVERVRLLFGPHHYVNLRKEADGRITFEVGATHHGFKADASEVNGELEKIVEEVRKSRPHTRTD